MKTKFSVIAISLFFFCALTKAQWVQTGLTSVRINTIVVSNNNLFAGTNGSGIYTSTNNGLNWSAVNNGLTNTFVRALLVNGTYLFAGTYGGSVFRSTDNGASWSTAGNGITNPYILTFTARDTNLFAGSEFTAGNVFRSTNNGSSWGLTNNGIPSTTVHTLAVNGTNLFAGTNGSGIYISTNNGLNWSSVNNGLTNTYIHSIASSGSDIFAGSEGGLVYISTNNGSSWSGINVSSAGSTFNTFVFSGTNIFAGASGGGVFLSIDNGLSWNAVNTGLTDTDVLSLAVKDDTLFAGTFNSGVWKRPLAEIVPVELVSFTANVNENDVILNWNTATETNNSGFQIERSENLEAEHAVWEMVGFVSGSGTTTEPTSYSFTDKHLSSGKYQYRLKQIDFDGTFEYSSIIEVEITSPTSFALEQNYPNPFNPSTKIRFNIPDVGSELAQTTLKVYDVLGNEVAILVNEEKPSGRYEIEFDASSLTSGVYFYRLQSGSFIETKKMILLR
ncbi:T9SS type A sorting domain-containing protein [Ignavibacterium album]|uniref:T9SS type A sorting domain-containing protein n=1 Tax=Ignavibacterium album TaxID=591197 RepID=UPI0026F157FF|nr:T9SS type A sorting domain-containing protein [Ignavibacterium album]